MVLEALSVGRFVGQSVGESGKLSDEQFDGHYREQDDGQRTVRLCKRLIIHDKLL